MSMIRRASALGILLLASGAHAESQAERKIEFHLPPQRLSTALAELAAQSNLRIVFDNASVKGQTERLEGTYTARDAIEKLLSRTELQYEFVDERTIEVRAKPPATSMAHGSENLRLAQAQTGVVNTAQSVTPEATGSSVKIEEIVVTAQKRVERLVDTPQSVSVLSSDTLSRLGATQFRDFASTVPGLSYSTQGAGYTQVSLRGVTAGIDVGPTVGIYVDEVPYGSSSTFAYASALALDVGLFDLDRIEVLRGPQGTLYGASTMGGLIKYVTKKPDASRFGIDSQIGASSTDSGGMSYNATASINAPIASGKAAVRASGFYSRDGGYIDNLGLGDRDVNRSNIHGGRLDLLLTPTDALTVRITGFQQNISRDGQGTADFAFSGAQPNGSLNQRRQIAEPFEQRFQLASASLTYDLEWASLTSISNYQKARADFSQDLSALLLPVLGLCPPFCRSYSAVGQAVAVETDRFTQEVRLVSSGDRKIEWIVGGFYTHEKSDVGAEYLLRDPSGQLAVNDLYFFQSPSKYEERAVFGDLTWHLTDKLDVTGGARYASSSQSFEQTGSGLFGITTPARSSDDDVLTYLANARYHFNAHTTGYVRYATGYRPGGPNFIGSDPVTGLPIGSPTYEADRLKSYEIGVKGETTDRRFGFDLGTYYIDWSNIQIFVLQGSFSGIGNASGGASVRGAELSLTARPIDRLALTGAFAWQNAEISKSDVALGATKGEALPNVPRFTAAISADYELGVGAAQPTLGATAQFVDDRMASFNASTYPQYALPSYTTVDLRAGFVVSRVNLQLYVRNVFDERGQLSAFTPLGAPRVAITQPRTFGITATSRF